MNLFAILEKNTRAMSSSGGLSRRRVAQCTDDDDSPKGSASSPTALHAGSAFEGGSKIAYDPRDRVQDATDEARLRGKMPKLTIMEEVLLLGLKDKQVCKQVIMLLAVEKLNSFTGVFVVLE